MSITIEELDKAIEKAASFQSMTVEGEAVATPDKKIALNFFAIICYHSPFLFSKKAFP